MEKTETPTKLAQAKAYLDFAFELFGITLPVTVNESKGTISFEDVCIHIPQTGSFHRTVAGTELVGSFIDPMEAVVEAVVHSVAAKARGALREAIAHHVGHV